MEKHHDSCMLDLDVQLGSSSISFVVGSDNGLSAVCISGSLTLVDPVSSRFITDLQVFIFELIE